MNGPQLFVGLLAVENGVHVPPAGEQHPVAQGKGPLHLVGFLAFSDEGEHERDTAVLHDAADAGIVRVVPRHHLAGHRVLRPHDIAKNANHRFAHYRIILPVRPSPEAEFEAPASGTRPWSVPKAPPPAQNPAGIYG